MVDHIRPYWYGSNGPVNWRQGKRKGATENSATGAAAENPPAVTASQQAVAVQPTTGGAAPVTNSLASVQKQAGAATPETIGIKDILKDVTSTMDALGVDDPTRQAVKLYLGAIAHQATEANPSRSLIREALKSVGTVMDRFITTTLKQPSRVVRDWVEALLLQPVQYHDATLDVESIASGGAAPVGDESSQEREVPSSPAVVSDLAKEASNNQWEPIKALLKQQQWQKATPLLKNWVENANTPAEAARGWRALVRVYETQNNNDALNTAYPQALQWGQQAYDAAKNTPDASKIARHLAQVANNYGCWLHRQPDTTPKEAVQAWKTARSWAIVGDKTQLPDIYANMAAGYEALNKPNLTLKALNKGLQAAHRLGDTEASLHLAARQASLA
ncbi:MAG: hypothetical protein QE263_03280 [Vampirovibrionales bacterium]|nr:hypothetical protein [Vampirovibrionales bacterium]